MQSPFDRGFGRRQVPWYKTPAALICYGFVATCLLCFCVGLYMGGTRREKTVDTKFSGFQHELLRQLELDDDVYRLEEEIAMLRNRLLGFVETKEGLDNAIASTRRHIDAHNRFKAAGTASAKAQLAAAAAQGLDVDEPDPCAVFRSSLSLCANDVQDHGTIYEGALARAKAAGADVVAVEMMRNGEQGYL